MFHFDLFSATLLSRFEINLTRRESNTAELLISSDDRPQIDFRNCKFGVVTLFVNKNVDVHVHIIVVFKNRWGPTVFLAQGPISSVALPCTQQMQITTKLD